MKRQSFGSKSGFTLIEIMLVITIFGAFILATNIFNYSPQTESERADRMVVSVSSIVKTALQNIAIGKMPKRDGNIAAIIVMDVSTGGIITRYYTGTTATVPIQSESFVFPYFDNDARYEFKNITWTGSSSVVTGATLSGQLIIEPTNITFSGAGITGSGYAILEIKVGYLTRSRKVILDRRTGKITETKIY